MVVNSTGIFFFPLCHTWEYGQPPFRQVHERLENDRYMHVSHQN